MKKTTLYICFFVPFIIGGCSSLKYPQITGVQNFNVSDFSTDMKLKFDVNIKNPNNYGVTLRSMKIDVLLDDSLISGVGLDNKERIGANRSATLPITIKPRIIGFPKLGWLALSQLFKKDDKNFAIKGEVVVSKFIFRKKYHFTWPKN